jgi:hypothetical protein
LLAIIFYLRDKKIFSLSLVFIGSSFWYWFGYFRLPVLISSVAEEMWWVQILAWGFITPIFLFSIFVALSFFKDEKKFWFIPFFGLIAFCFPKLWFLAIPNILIVIDICLNLLQDRKNYMFFMQCLVFALILGQVLRVGILTYEAWNYKQESNCYLVNHEYLARIQGKSLYYNQASLSTYNECLSQEGLHNGK